MKSGDKSPHSKRESVLYGHTPRDRKDVDGSPSQGRPSGCAEIYVKLGWENPTGSLKDRTAQAVISRAEEGGRLGTPVRSRYCNSVPARDPELHLWVLEQTLTPQSLFCRPLRGLAKIENQILHF